MKYLKSFNKFESYSLLEDEDLNFYFDYIGDDLLLEQPLPSRIFRNILKPKNFKDLKVTSSEPPNVRLKRKVEIPKNAPKRKPNLGIEEIGDDLILINKPSQNSTWINDRVGKTIKQIFAKDKLTGKIDETQYVLLKVDQGGKFGKHYFMSAHMDNNIQAGKAFKRLMSFIPKGSYFGEPSIGSLSTDSLYNIFKRIKSGKFEYEIKGTLKLNSSGTKRYQTEIKKTAMGNPNNSIMFPNKKDADILAEAINKDLRTLNDERLLCKVVENKNVGRILKNDSQVFYIEIPNIFLIVK